MQVAHRPPTTRWSSTASASCTCAWCWSADQPRPRSRHQAAEDRLPRNDHADRRRPPPPQEADRRRRAVRRGVPRASSSRLAARQRRLRDRQRSLRRHHPGPVHPRGRERHPRPARARASSPATRCRTSASRSTTASTTRSTARKSPSAPPASRRSRTRCRRPSPVLLEPIVNMEVTAPGDRMGTSPATSRRAARRIQGTDIRPRRHHRDGPGAAGGGHAVPVPAQERDRRGGQLRDGAEPLRPGPAAQAAGTRIRLETRRGRRMNDATPRSDTRIMAVFCDFENIALGVRDAKIRRFDIEQGARAAAAQGPHRRQEGLLRLGALQGLQARRCTRRPSS